MQLNAERPFIITNRLTDVIFLARITTALIGSPLVTRGMTVITKLKKTDNLQLHKLPRSS
jgi:hypothetical protein